jgi:hypothetical protein
VRLVISVDGLPSSSLAASETRAGPELIFANGWSQAHGWPQEARILIVPRAEDVRLELWLTPETWPIQLLPVEDGTWPVLVRAGHHYIVGVLGGDCAWAPREIWVPIGAPQMQVQLHADVEVHGTLLLETQDEQARKRGADLVVWIEDSERGIPLAKYLRGDRDPWPLPLELPPGSFRIVVDGDPFLDSIHGTLGRPSSHGRTAQLVEVVAGTTRRVPLTVSAIARVRLQLEGKLTPADVEGTIRDFGEYTTSRYEYWAERAVISLRDGARWPLPVIFREEQEAGEYSDAFGDYLRAHLQLGSTQVSEPLPAGRFRIEARLRGGRTVTREIELLAGQTTNVTLRFEDN